MKKSIVGCGVAQRTINMGGTGLSLFKPLISEYNRLSTHLRGCPGFDSPPKVHPADCGYTLDAGYSVFDRSRTNKRPNLYLLGDLVTNKSLASFLKRDSSSAVAGYGMRWVRIFVLYPRPFHGHKTVCIPRLLYNTFPLRPSQAFLYQNISRIYIL